MTLLVEDLTGTALARAVSAAQAHLRSDAAGELDTLPHREIMRRAKTLLSVIVAVERSGGDVDAALVVSAMRHVDALAVLQSPGGLFTGGDNVQSPPDSAFTVNDVCDTLEFTSGSTVDGLAVVTQTLRGIARAAAEPLLVGGVHTPNHRWELASALVRLHRLTGDARLVERADDWLAEGIDIDVDGHYSERSPNYAAHVTNPSLLAIARILHRGGLRDIVERNLAATLELIRPDGTVETLASRRQDQRHPFSLAPYYVAYRSLALSTSRGDFAWAAERAAEVGGLDHTVLAELLLEPSLEKELPASSSPAPRHSAFSATLGLGAKRVDEVESVVFGGSDYSAQRVVRSGLSSDPTFLRLFAGRAVLDSVRLSRAFFDLGPFRADSIDATGDDRYLLRETVTAAYYQPMRPEQRDAHGRYDLADDGRFSAAMAFGDRPRDEVTMSTVVEAVLLDDGVDLVVTIEAPPVAWSLELVFRPGGVLTGVEPAGDGAWVLTGDTGTYRVGDDRLVFGPGAAAPPRGAPLYRPGQDYGVAGGTDGAEGVRVYLVGTTPTAFTLTLRAENGAAR